MTMTKTSPPMTGHLFDTIIVVSTDKEFCIDPSKRRCWKLLETVVSYLKLYIGWYMWCYWWLHSCISSDIT